MDTIVAAWWSWMIPMLWQVSLLVAILAVIDRLIRGWAWPQVRYALWLLVVVKLVIPPSWVLPGGGLPTLVARMTSAVESGLVAGGPVVEDSQPGSKPGAAPGAEAGGATVLVPGRAGDAAIQARSTVFWPTVAFLVWVAGMIVIGSIILLRTARLARWHREQKARPTIPSWFHELLMETSERLGLERVPAVVFSDRAVTPAVYGLLRPVLLLPAHSTDTLTRQDAEHVLLHEMAHLKRGDLVGHAVFLILRVVYWFNPFVAFAHRQVKHIREICCDLTVAGVLREKTAGYRKTLVDTARRLLTESIEPGMGLVGVFEEPYKVLARLRWLERPTWEHGRLMTVVAALVAVLAAPLLLPMAADGAALGAMSGEERPQDNGPSRSDGRVPAGVSDVDAPHTYIRSVFRKEQLILGFVVKSEVAAVSETWVGRDIISVSERDRTVILDRRVEKIILIDHPSETWVEASLPLEIGDVLGEELQRGRRDIRTTGEVEATEDSRKILGRRCPEFQVSSWSSRGSTRSNQQSFSVWTTLDVPFDLTLLDRVLFNLRLLYNRDAGFRRELAKMPGLQMRLEIRRDAGLVVTRLVDEVEEISSLAPPVGIYQPPRAYRLINRFEHLDF